MTTSLRPLGQILMLESSGKWRAALRRVWDQPAIGLDVLLDSNEFLARCDRLPTVGILDLTPAQIGELSRRLKEHLWGRNLAIWLVVDDARDDGDQLASSARRLGYAGVLHSLSQLPYLHRAIQRFFRNAAPVELPLEERIELQFPWRRPSRPV